MRLLLRVMACAGVCGAAAFSQPTIGGIVNNASYAMTGLPNAGIARGSMFAIFGTNLGPTQIAYQPSFPLQTTLAGTSVTITAVGNSFMAIPVYVSATQTGAVLPSGVPSGAATVTVTANGQTSTAFPITVVDNGFGIFAVNQAGSGPGVVTNATTFTPVAQVAAAKPGDFMTIWGTGLGPITTDETQPPPQTDMTDVPVHVWLGGKEAQVNYRGRASCCAGLDQIVFVVPSGVSGCYASVLVQAGNSVSNSTTMPVAVSGGTCDDPGGITASDIESIASKPSFNLGIVYLARFQPAITIFPGVPPIPIALDEGSAAFATYTPALAARALSPFRVPSVGSCLVNTFKGDATNGIPSDPTVAPGLDAGISIPITGPKDTKPLKQDAKGYYSASLSENSSTNPAGTPFLERGTYTIANGNGGADVQAFSVTATLPDPDPITWTNQSNISGATRGQNLTVTWTTTNPNAIVVISGTSTTPVGTDTIGAAFYCTAPASAGTFTVPGAVLSALPVSTPTTGSIVPPGLLFLGSGTITKFTAPGLDLGYVEISSQNGIEVNYQ